MATKDRATAKADALEKDWTADVEAITYQEFNRIPNIHMLRKPAWATGEKSPLSEIPPVEYQKLEMAGGFWGSLLSIPMVLALSLPILLVFFVTLIHYGAFPDSITPHMFLAVQNNKNDSVPLLGFWILALAVFVPWTKMVCRFESWISNYVT
jgi:hypothetical protein